MAFEVGYEAGNQLASSGVLISMGLYGAPGDFFAGVRTGYKQALLSLHHTKELL